jgi:UDP-N-acetylglucosamine 2-epimerase (non-hydrolysing)
MRKKIIVFLGTRPEAIKLAPVIDVLNADPYFHTLVCSTGQHREMLQQVVDFFGIPVHFTLDVMAPDQQLADLTAKLLVRIDALLKQEQPDYIIVQGDTTTTFVASLAAFYNKVQVLHVEAGLRTGNKFSPFPEEMNRVFTSKLTDFHFPPTDQSRDNLLKEGVPADRMLVTGNTVIDALFMGLRRIGDTVPDSIAEHGLQHMRQYMLVTMHRRENHGTGIRNICEAINRITADTGIEVIFPVHLNPNVRNDVYELLSGNTRVKLVPPFAYSGFLWLLNNARIILTDSGGVQEEAPSLGKPVLLLRDTTERPEAVEAGTVLQTGSNAALIYTEAIRLLTNDDAYARMSAISNPYGDGHAAERIATAIKALG